MRYFSREHRSLWAVLALFALVRLLVIPTFGLGVDEAHYVLYGRYLDLSYFDHPPRVGWAQALFSALFGETPFGVRLSAVLIGIFASFSVYVLLHRISSDRSKALLGVVALNASFLFNALFMMLMPDTLLFFLLVPILFATLAVEKENSLRNWLFLGALLGLAGLAKYTAVLFLAPIALYFLLRRRFELFITPKLIPAVLVALVIISPVILWNIEHDWISFTYQSGHVVGSNRINWGAFGQSIAAQFGAYSPFLFPLAFYGLVRALRSKQDLLFLSGLFGLVLIVFFSYASLYKRALPHWSSPFYLLFIPIGTYYLSQVQGFWKKYLRFALVVSLLITVIAYAELAFKFIPTPDYKSPLRDIYGFDQVMKGANSLIQDSDKEALAVTNWTLASRALYYNSGHHSDVYLADRRNDQFDLWQHGSPLGKDLLVINTHFYHRDVNAWMQCAEVEKARSLDIMLHGAKVNTIDYIWCRDFRGLKN